MSWQRGGRWVSFAPALIVAVLVAVLLGTSLADWGAQRGRESPPASSGATATPAASTASPVTPPPTPGVPAGTYWSAGLGYSIDTPSPWHRSICSPRIVTQEGDVPAQEVFFAVAARDERGTDVGFPFPTIRVLVEANPQGLSPRQLAEQPLRVGGSIDEIVEDVTFAGRPAARKGVPGAVRARYFVANGGRMYEVGPPTGLATDAATERSIAAIVASFRFLTDAEVATARAALPAPLPPRAPEQVASGIAAAFAAKDADALAEFLSACVTTAGENAGASYVSREKYVSDLRAAFAAGLAVTVQASPLQGDRATGGLTIASTWQDSRGTKERKLMLQRYENDRWQWIGTLERYS